MRPRENGVRCLRARRAISGVLLPEEQRELTACDQADGRLHPLGGAPGGGGKAARSGQNTELSAGSGLRPVGGEHVALPGGGAGQGLRAADEIRLSRIG